MEAKTHYCSDNRAEFPSNGKPLPLKFRFRIKTSKDTNDINDCQIIEAPENRKAHPVFRKIDTKRQETKITQKVNANKPKEGDNIPYFFMSSQQKRETILKRNLEKLNDQRQKRRLEDKEFFGGKTLNPFFLQHRNFTNVSPTKEKKVIDTTIDDLPCFPLISHIQYSTTDFTIKDLPYKLEFHDDYDDDDEISIEPYNDKMDLIQRIKSNENLEKYFKVTKEPEKVNETKYLDPWVLQYAPSSHKGMCGNEEWIYFIHSWLIKWKQLLYKLRNPNKRNQSQIDLHNTLLIHGPYGIGKTSSIYACSKELGFTVIEVNASNHRSGHYIKNLLGEAMQSHRMKNTQEDISLILFDEIDIVFPQDKGFYSTLIDLIETSKRPIILICNSITSQISSKLLKNKKVLGISFQIPPINSIVNTLNNILGNEKKNLENSDLIRLVIQKQGDIRSCINDLQFWSPIDLQKIPSRIQNDENSSFLTRLISSHISPHIYKNFLRTRMELWWIFSNRLVEIENYNDYDFTYECDRLCSVISALFHENMINFYQSNSQMLFSDPLFPFIGIFGENDKSIDNQTNKEVNQLRNSLIHYLMLTKDALSISDILMKFKHNKIIERMDPKYQLIQLLSMYIMKSYHFSMDIMKQLINSTSFKTETYDKDNIKNVFSQRDFIVDNSINLRKDHLCRYLVAKNINYKTRYRCYSTEYFPFIKQLACIEYERRMNNTKRRYVPIFDWNAMNISDEVFNELIIYNYSQLNVN